MALIHSPKNPTMKAPLFLALVILFLSSCKKDRSADGDTPPPGNCSVSKSQAENIQIFPADNPWNQDISGAAIDPFSDSIIARIGTSHLHPDFGSGTWEGAPIGIPYVAVCGDQHKYSVNFLDWPNESDAGPYAIPLDAPIEGNGVGDAHVIAVDIQNGILYELYNAEMKNGNWASSNGAIFNLGSNALRTEGWTSADAAGLPIFPGLVRYEEVLKGEIDHAIRFTLTSSNVKPAYISPARHKVNSTGGKYSLPFGARIKLKNSFDISTYPARVQVILKAMKKYGLMLADIGSNLYISGAPDERWNNDELNYLKNLRGSDFEVVKFNP
jgi:hypothetical protein